MLTTFEVLLYCSSLVVVLPLAIFSLLTGSKAPPNTWIAKYYDAQKYLGPSGNIMLIAFSVDTISKLAVHFGLMAPPGGMAGVAIPFASLATLLLYLGCWFSAASKVRNARKSKPPA